MAETPGGGTCDDEASETAGSDIVGQGISEDGYQTRLATEGQGRGTGLCGGAWQGREPSAGLYGMPGLRVAARGYRGDGMGAAELCGVALSEGYVPDIRASDGHEGFYAYYQLDSAGEPDDSETEPGKEGELRTRYEGSHSPFGFVWQIASATGWSVDYILDGVNYQTLILMLSDAPRYMRKKQGGGNGVPSPERSAEDEANDIVGFFQSKLE